MCLGFLLFFETDFKLISSVLTHGENDRKDNFTAQTSLISLPQCYSSHFLIVLTAKALRDGFDSDSPISLLSWLRGTRYTVQKVPMQNR